MEGGWNKLELHKERLGFVALGRELKGQPPDPCAESLLHTADTIFLGWSTPFFIASAWGKQ